MFFFFCLCFPDHYTLIHTLTPWPLMHIFKGHDGSYHHVTSWCETTSPEVRGASNLSTAGRPHGASWVTGESQSFNLTCVAAHWWVMKFYWTCCQESFYKRQKSGRDQQMHGTTNRDKSLTTISTPIHALTSKCGEDKCSLRQCHWSFFYFCKHILNCILQYVIELILLKVSPVFLVCGKKDVEHGECITAAD